MLVILHVVLTKFLMHVVYGTEGLFCLPAQEHSLSGWGRGGRGRRQLAKLHSQPRSRERRILGHGMLLPTFRVEFPVSINNLIWI